MASSITKLDSLPAEIIKRIACFSTTRTVLSLFLVNRRLYTQCNDNTVFKAIISNANNLSDQLETKDWVPPTATEYARYALADQKAREWQLLHSSLDTANDGEKEQYSEGLQDLISWAPKLASLHHPINARIFVESLKNLPSSHITAVIKASLDFLLTYAVLSQAQQQQPLDSTKPDIITRLHSINKLISGIDFESFDPKNGPYVNPALFARALLAYTEQCPRIVSIPLPSPLKMTIPADFLPLPFSDISTQDFDSSHLKTMTSKSFLEDGEWVGYYSYSVNLHQPATFDPPMTGVRFTVESEDEYANLNGEGVDNVGQFTLDGAMRLETGAVVIRKLYNQGLWWVWSGTMTPFGIVGLWGREEAWNRNSGCVWLWKRQWSDESLSL